MEDVYRTLNKASTVQDVSTTVRSCLVGLLSLMVLSRLPENSDFNVTREKIPHAERRRDSLCNGPHGRSPLSFGMNAWIYPNGGVDPAARAPVAAGSRRGTAAAFCRFPTNLAPKVCVMTALGPLRTIEQDRRR